MTYHMRCHASGKDAVWACDCVVWGAKHNAAQGDAKHNAEWSAKHNAEWSAKHNAWWGAKHNAVRGIKENLSTRENLNTRENREREPEFRRRFMIVRERKSLKCTKDDIERNWNNDKLKHLKWVWDTRLMNAPEEKNESSRTQEKKNVETVFWNLGSKQKSMDYNDSTRHQQGK